MLHAFEAHTFGGNMKALQKFVTPQQLTHLHHLIGNDMCRAVDMWVSKNKVSAREHAQLREAKSLVGSLKYPDFIQSVRMDEMLWALKWFQERLESLHSKLFDQAAQMLGASLNEAHPLPHDLERRIANELVIVSRVETAVSLKEAV